MSQDKKYKVGVVLSGGGARGFAHLGALQAMHENDIYPEVISGVSAGAIAGAFYAYGMSPLDAYELLKKKGVFEYSKLNLPLNGLLSINGLIEEIKENIPCKNIEDLNKPAVFAATNLNQGKINYFDKGTLCDIVGASACIPILFSPVKIGKELYVDGGLFDNLPVSPIREECEKLIGVNISPVNESNDLDSMGDIAARVFQLSVSSTKVHSIPQCDIVVEPMELADYSILNSNVAEEVYEIGYQTTIKELKKHDLEDWQ